MDDQTTLATFADEDEGLTDDSIAASIQIDYAEIMAATDPHQPGGRIVYNSYDYETQEEADAALEEFFTRIIEAPHEENNQAEFQLYGPSEARHRQVSYFPSRHSRDKAGASHS